MRVLHFIYDDPKNPWVGGGGAVRVAELYRRLRDRLESVTIATGAFPGAMDETIDAIRYIRLGAERPYALSRMTYSIAASRLLARGGYDVAVYDFSTYTPLRLPRGKPVGVTVHHITGRTAADRWGEPVGRAIAAQELARLRQGRFFSATSAVTYEQLRKLIGPAAEIVSVQAGVPDELFDLERAESDYLLYFGRLDWFQKGLDVMLDAMKLLVARRPGLRLKVAGRGKDLPRLVEQAGQLGIAANLEVLGAVGDAERDVLFAGARVLLMPSRFEGFGMVAAEAMAAGIPIVATTAGSLPEVVDPPEGGVLVPPGDPESLAAAVDALLSDPERRHALGKSARRSAERFRWDRVAEQHLEFLQRIQSAHAHAKSSQNV